MRISEKKQKNRKIFVLSETKYLLPCNYWPYKISVSRHAELFSQDLNLLRETFNTLVETCTCIQKLLEK